MAPLGDFVKYGDRERLAIEAEKTALAHELAVTTNEFYVPRVLESSDQRLVLERIHGIVPLRRALRSMTSRNRQRHLAFRTGRVLAHVHSKLCINTRRLLMPHPFCDEDIVAIHGDFGWTNVQYAEDRDLICVLDWSTPSWLNAWCTHGSSGWDIGLFITDLFFFRRGDRREMGGPRPLGKAFLAGYRSIRPLPQHYRRAIRQVSALYYRSALPASHPNLRLLRLGQAALFL